MFNNMTPYDIYIFVLCLVVFVMLTLVFSIMIGNLASLTIRLIRYGGMDKQIKTEYKKRAAKKPSRFGAIMDRVISVVLCLVMCAAFLFSLSLQLNESKVSEDVPSLKVIKSSSMSEKYKDNTYLEGLDNQVQTFDMIVTYPIPAEEDLRLYDVIYYELDGDMVLHRIVEIQEPNATHPNERWYITQGDAVPSPDLAPVRYSQMRGIYRNESIPFVGSFVMFMQSPAGWLCILLIVFALAATPLVERKIAIEKELRLQVMRYGAVLPPKARPVRIPAVPLLLSHTRFDLRIQKQAPKISVSLQQIKNTIPLHKQNRGD